LPQRERSNGCKRAASLVLSAAMALQIPVTGSVMLAEKALASETVTVLAAQPPEQAVTAAQQSELRLIGEQPVTSGATMRTYEYVTQRGQVRVSTIVRIIAVDLRNPYVQLDVMTGTAGGGLASRQTVTAMTREHGAVAGVNGDLFHMQLTLPPIGPVIDGGQMLASPYSPEGWYMFGLTGDRRPVIDFFTFDGQIIAPDGAAYPLAGINRSPTWRNGVHSHKDNVFLYTSDWGALDRGNDGNTTPNEILVENGIVTRMEFGKKLDIEAVPENSIILRANGKAAEFLKSHFHVGDPLVFHYDLKPLDGGSPVRGQDLQMLIGGHTLLVNEGKPTAFTANINDVSGAAARARTGIGFSQDSRFVYLITADYAGDSKGLTLKEFQDLMVMAGVWKGLNLDGGGSTTMAVRPLGETVPVLVNQPQEGSQRKVVNGIGVYTTAPQGELLGFALSGPALVFMNEKAAYIAKGYDTFYNPLSGAESLIQWSLEKAIGKVDGGVFVPSRPGRTAIVGRYKDFTQRFEVKVAGRDDLASLTMETGDIVITEGESYKISVSATLVDGLKKKVPNESIEWEFIGFTGTMDGDTLTVHHIEAEDAVQIIARYDGFSTMITVPIGWETLWTDFERQAPEVQFIGYPAGVEGFAEVVNGLPGTPDDNRALYVGYRFAEGAAGQTHAAYASFNADQGLDIPGKPTAMKIRVFGDRSGNWVRAELVDAAGASHLVDIARDVDWYGFRDLTVDLTSYKLQYPVKLKRLYVARPANSGEERQRAGGVGFDDISFVFEGRMTDPELPHIFLTIDKTEMTVNGDVYHIDQAPLIRKQTTFVPVRFVVEAMQGHVQWNEKERQVTVRKGAHIIELWVDRNEAAIDGRRVVLPAAPFIENRRTLVPLRIISETFGWEVVWDGKERTVTLQ